MSSVLDALTPAELAEVEAAVHTRRMERHLVDAMLSRLLADLLVRSVKVADPSAGAEWSVSVPGGSVWEVSAIRYLLADSATVATRNSFVLYRDADGNELLRFAPNSSQSASQTKNYNYASTLVLATAAPAIISSLPSPPFVLTGGQTVGTSTVGLDVGDQYSGVILTVTELSPIRIVNACRQLLGDLDSAGGIRYGEVR